MDWRWRCCSWARRGERLEPGKWGRDDLQTMLEGPPGFGEVLFTRLGSIQSRDEGRSTDCLWVEHHPGPETRLPPFAPSGLEE